MLRIEAVEALLVDDVARIRESAEDTGERLEQLGRARRRAGFVAAIDWLAILALFALRDTAADFLTLGANERSIFSIAVLAIAVHSGFRLGQWEKYRAVEDAVRSVARLRGD